MRQKYSEVFFLSAVLAGTPQGEWSSQGGDHRKSSCTFTARPVLVKADSTQQPREMDWIWLLV